MYVCISVYHMHADAPGGHKIALSPPRTAITDVCEPLDESSKGKSRKEGMRREEEGWKKRCVSNVSFL